MKPSLPPGVLAAVARPGLSLLARSWRIETAGDAAWRELVAAGRPYVFLGWHEVMLPLLWYHRGRGITLVVSEGREGRYLAAYTTRLGYRVVWGSSTRGGVRALLGAVQALREGRPAAFTPDGPRGPRRVFKDGALLAAQRGRAHVVVLHAGANRSWRLRSWDRFLVPRPFARVRIAFGTPFLVEPGAEGLAEGRRRVLSELTSVVRESRWDDVVIPAG